MLLEFIVLAAYVGGLVGFGRLHWPSCDYHGALLVAKLHLAFYALMIYVGNLDLSGLRIGNLGGLALSDLVVNVGLSL